MRQNSQSFIFGIRYTFWEMVCKYNKRMGGKPMKRILRLISFTILLVMMMAVIVNADTSTNGPTVQEFTFDASLQDMTL